MNHLAPASELMFFDGQPLAHVVAYQDDLLEKRRRRQAEAFARDLGRSRRA